MLSIKGLSKSFATANGTQEVLHNLDLEIKEGEFVTLIGPSGCGKSTLLKIVAGLDTDYQGSVLLNGKQIVQPSVDQGFIFQEHRLFPWFTVEKNIAADLSLRDPQVRKRVDQLLELVRLKDFAKAYPRELSGGMSQRVAIGRALLRNPQVLLLDEPFGALDSFTRSHMQEALLEIWRNNRTTMMFVTHDIDESIFLANRVVIMGDKPGGIRDIVTIDLPYPRKRASSSFQELRFQVLSRFERVETLELVEGTGI